MWQLCYLVTHEWQCKSFGMFETLILYFRVEEHFFVLLHLEDRYTQRQQPTTATACHYTHHISKENSYLLWFEFFKGKIDSS